MVPFKNYNNILSIAADQTVNRVIIEKNVEQLGFFGYLYEPDEDPGDLQPLV